MAHRSHLLLVGAGLLAALQHTPPAYSQEEAEPPAGAIQAADALGSKAVDEAALEAQRGGAETVTLNDMKLNGTVADNQASNVMSGSNYVTQGSLTGNSGLTTVVQNSGSNVLIQNATIVNLRLQ